MTPERGAIPGWARRERQGDLEWIGENLDILAPAARAAYREQGRGAIVVDTTRQPIPGLGHPFAYAPLAVIEARDDEDTQRMVRGYNPREELVLVLLKSQGRASTYRVQAFQRLWERPGR